MDYRLTAKVTYEDKSEDIDATRQALQIIIEDRLVRLRGLRFKVSEVKVGGDSQMSSQKVYCVKDSEFYKKIKTGITIGYSVANIRGGLFECPVCKNRVMSDFGEPFEGRI
ncbi:MAG TPA: hypothetical protein VF910_07640 [Candidatus Bathyarchaeia archaeon]